MHSQLALTEHASLNLAQLILLDPVDGMKDWFVCDKTNHNKAVIVSLFLGYGPHLKVEVESFFLCRSTLPLTLGVGERLKSRGFNWYNEQVKGAAK